MPRPPPLTSSMNNSTLDPGACEPSRRGRREVAPPVNGELHATSLQPTTPIEHVTNFTSLNASMSVPNQRGRREVSGGPGELNAPSLEPSTPMEYVTNFTSLNTSMAVPNQRGRREVDCGADELNRTSLIPTAVEHHTVASLDRSIATVSSLRSASVLPEQAPPVLRGRYISAEAHAVHTAGNGAAHITGGKQHVPVPERRHGPRCPMVLATRCGMPLDTRPTAIGTFLASPCTGLCLELRQPNIIRSNRVSKESITAWGTLMAHLTVSFATLSRTKRQNQEAWHVRFPSSSDTAAGSYVVAEKDCRFLARTARHRSHLADANQRWRTVITLMELKLARSFVAPTRRPDSGYVFHLLCVHRITPSAFDRFG